MTTIALPATLKRNRLDRRPALRSRRPRTASEPVLPGASSPGRIVRPRRFGDCYRWADGSWTAAG